LEFGINLSKNDKEKLKNEIDFISSLKELSVRKKEIKYLIAKLECESKLIKNYNESVQKLIQEKNKLINEEKEIDEKIKKICEEYEKIK
jgi:hypothetical protein